MIIANYLPKEYHSNVCFEDDLNFGQVLLTSKVVLAAHAFITILYPFSGLSLISYQAF